MVEEMLSSSVNLDLVVKSGTEFYTRDQDRQRTVKVLQNCATVISFRCVLTQFFLVSEQFALEFFFI